MIIKDNFGENNLLFCYYDFMKETSQRPLDWQELFEFMNFRKTHARLREFANAQAKALGG